MPTEITPAKLDAIRQQIPEYARLSDTDLMDRLDKMGALHPEEPPLRAAFTGSKAELAGDVASTVSGAGMFAGGLAGAATPIPGGAAAGAFAGGGLAKSASLKVYDWLGVPRPDETKFMGVVSLGQQTPLKEFFSGGLEGAAFEGVPAGVALAGRAARNAFVRPLSRAAALAPNAAVARTATREGIPLGIDEITQSPALRGGRSRLAKTATGATEAQIRTAEIEDASVNAITDALGSIGPGVSPSTVAGTLRGEVGSPGVLGKIEEMLRGQRAAKYAEIDKLSEGTPIVKLDNLKAEGKELLGRADMGLSQKGFPKTMRRSALGRGIVEEAASGGDVTPDIGKLTKGQYTAEDIQKNQALKGLIDELTQKAKPLTLTEADALRGRLSEIGRQASTRANPDIYLAEAATRLKKAIDLDMDAAADSLPKGSQIKQKYEDARAFVRETRSKAFRGAIKYLSDSDPSQLAKSISVNDTETINAIDKVLGKEGKLGQVGPTYAKEAIRRIWTHDFFFGEGTPGPTELQGITAQAKKLSPEFVDAMYGKTGTKTREAFDRMVEIGRAAERVNFQLGTRASTEEVGQAMDAAAGMLAHQKFLLVGGIKRFAASHFLTKVVNEPKLYDAVLKGIYEYPKNPGRSFAMFSQAMRMAYPGVKVGMRVAKGDEE